jgi:hypothetical protein
MEELLTYKKFKDLEIANDISEKLKEGGIYFEIEKEKEFLDSGFSNNPLQTNFKIKIEPSDFLKADKVLENYYLNLLDKIPKDYYLFSFTNKELFEIISKQDEWGDLDYQLAQKILSDRGDAVSQDEVQALKSKRIKVLSKPEQPQTQLVLIGYAINSISCLSLFLNLKFRFIWIMGAGILGAIISQTKRTLPTGELAFTFNEKDRKHGKIITLLSIFFFFVILILLYLNRIQLTQNPF